MDKSGIYRKILSEYENTRFKNEEERRKKIEKIYAEIPMIKEVDSKIKKIGIKSAKKILKGENFDYKSELSDLKAAKTALLLNNGYERDYLDLKYDCGFCKDTGYVDGEKCSCFKQKLAEEFYQMSNLKEVLQKENFKNFRFSVFSDEKNENEEISPREKMVEIVDTCENFITNFNDSKVRNLLFYGKTGRGKTYLANCIAKELLDEGYTVVYQTAIELVNLLEEYRFYRKKGDDSIREGYNFIMDSDLLIIDDLGTENSNAFTISELFNIINTRNLRRKKILISTNLDPADIARVYTDRIYSRILERFDIYKFIGEDLRLKQ